jgi:hypothetical protein
MQNKIVSSIDANQAYWHLVLDHASRPWTAFYLGKKLYQFNRMAQGQRPRLLGRSHEDYIFCRNHDRNKKVNKQKPCLSIAR